MGHGEIVILKVHARPGYPVISPRQNQAQASRVNRKERGIKKTSGRLFANLLEVTRRGESVKVVERGDGISG